MDLHILFSQKPEEGAEGDATPLSIHLDEEVQFRCSEFVQKEINRFKDHIQDSYPHAKGDETDGSGAEESDGEHTKKGKKAKPKAVDVDRRKRESSQKQQNYPPLIFMVKCRKRQSISNASTSSFASCSRS